MLTKSNAVFVGRVTDVWPPRETIADESRRLTLSQLKQTMLERWRGALSAEQERYIRTTTDKDDLEFRFGFIQRVRFTVSELLAGPQIREVYTDTTSCGYRFETGVTYLVDAYSDVTRYQVRACSRTGRVESDEAIEDLKALRAWRTGNPLPPRIYGRINVRDLRQDTRVRLIDDQDREERLARVDPDGRFSLDNLTKTKHRFQAEDARDKGEILIDLSRIGCFEAIPWFSEGWHIGGSPVTLGPDPIILESPPLILPSK
jgi:hypothetical protein